MGVLLHLWRYNIDFFRKNASVQWRYNMAVPLYYYLIGRKLFGEEMKYPLFRLGHFPEWMLRRKLYLDFSGRQDPKFRVPEHVRIPEERLRPLIPELATIQSGA